MLSLDLLDHGGVGLGSETTSDRHRKLPIPSYKGGSRSEPGEGESVAIFAEQPADIAARDRLLDRAMGPRWRKKSSEKLRRGRRPSEGLAFVAKDCDGRVVGTVRLWDVAVGCAFSPLEGEMAAKRPEGVNAAVLDVPMGCGARPRRPHPDPLRGSTLPSRGRESRALLLGPLAVDPAQKSAGIGSALMRHAIEEARRLGHGAILLVGDPEYYQRFGFGSAKTAQLAMPGPFEKRRLLALELVDGWLYGAEGVLKAAGRKARAEQGGLKRAA